MSEPGKKVFLNVPFDRQYRKLFDALVFTIHECGFVARCALETEDGSQVRLEKLYGIIAACRLGIPGAKQVEARYLRFRRHLPAMCSIEGLDGRDLTFLDYRMLIIGWQDENPR